MLANAQEYGGEKMKKIIYRMDSNTKASSFQKNSKKVEKWTLNSLSTMTLLTENQVASHYNNKNPKQMIQKQMYLWSKPITEISRNIGTFTVKSGKLTVSDPYYSTDEAAELQVRLTNVRKGDWTAAISYTADEVVTRLVAYSTEQNGDGKWCEHDQPIQIHSALAGIFDSTFFGKDDAISYEVKNVFDFKMTETGRKYYVACADAIASDAQGDVIPSGAVTMSGYLGGTYKVKVNYSGSSEIVGVMINFIEEE